MISPSASIDFLEELRLRRWARENYCFAEARQASWHPIVHDEMRRRDEEALSRDDLTVLSEFAEPTAPGDSTILTDLPTGMRHRALCAEDVAAGPSSIGRIVPLVPSPADVHGPHEITPPHSRQMQPVGSSELFVG